MSDNVFVDANVLVYVRDATEPAKQEMAERWLRELWSSGNGRISIQVLQEFYVTATQKLQPGMTRADAREDVTSLFSWQPVTQDRHLLVVSRVPWKSSGVASVELGYLSRLAVVKPERRGVIAFREAA